VSFVAITICVASQQVFITDRSIFKVKMEAARSSETLILHGVITHKTSI